MKTETTYNGWTNYATWRINLELWDGYETDYPVTADSVEEMTEEYINPDGEESIRVDYAMAFINNVNWYEIAEHVNQCNEISEEGES